MKKTTKVLYYLIPFVIFATMMVIHYILIFSLNEKVDDGILGLILVLSLLIVPFFIGSFSPSRHNFDYLITVLVPVAMMVCSLIIGYFFISDSYGRPGRDLEYAIKSAFSRPWVVMYIMMAIVTFVSSFHHIRLSKLLKRKKPLNTIK